MYIHEFVVSYKYHVRDHGTSTMGKDHSPLLSCYTLTIHCSMLSHTDNVCLAMMRNHCMIYCFRITSVCARKSIGLRNIGRDSCLYRSVGFPYTFLVGPVHLHKAIPRTFAHIVLLECVLLPFFALTQLFTVVPDSIPGCLDIVGIPEDSDPTWIFTRIAFHSCGDMLWSSDLVQLMLFIYFAYSMSRDHCRRCKKATQGTIAVLGMLWMLVAIVLIFVARYQYTMDVMISIVVTFFVVKDHGLYNTAVRCFIQKKRYYERQNYAKTSEIDLDAFEV